jgi:hypothetical protein
MRSSGDDEAGGRAANHLEAAQVAEEGNGVEADDRAGIVDARNSCAQQEPIVDRRVGPVAQNESFPAPSRVRLYLPT